MKARPNLSIILSILLALAIFAAALPQPVLADAGTVTASCQKTHTVKKGDTPYKIAHLYDIPWKVILKANNLPSDYQLKVGDKLCIPYKKGIAPVPGTVSITSKGDKITITATKFTKQSTYFVKVKDASIKATTWFKIGTLNVQKNKSVTIVYKLPKELKDTFRLSVCLKNVYTDDLTCFTVIHNK